MTPAQRLVLLALAEHANQDGGSCFPSIGTLESMTGLTRRGVTKALDALDGAVLRRERGGPGQVTRYRLLVNEPGATREQGTGFPREPGSLGNGVPPDREQGSPGRELSSLDVGNTVPPNRHKNRQLTVNEPLQRAQVRELGLATVVRQPQTAPPRDGGTRSGQILNDWRPGERVFAWAGKRGLTRDWVSAQVDEFVVYWSDVGSARKSWDATFINRLRDLQARPGRTRHDATPEQNLAAKDYRAGATPLERIPWLDTTALG